MSGFGDVEVFTSLSSTPDRCRLELLSSEVSSFPRLGADFGGDGEIGVPYICARVNLGSPLVLIRFRGGSLGMNGFGFLCLGFPKHKFASFANCFFSASVREGFFTS